VAAEVRNLSTRTTDAAREIQSLISSSVQQVKTGANLVRDVGTSLNVAIDGVRLIDTEVSGLVNTFVSYSDTLEALNSGASKLDQATQKSAAMAEDMKTSTDHLRARATELRDFVALFTLPNAGRDHVRIKQAA
jgi:methyl-accepting chemotaxis protein